MARARFYIFDLSESCAGSDAEMRRFRAEGHTTQRLLLMAKEGSPVQLRRLAAPLLLYADLAGAARLVRRALQVAMQ